MPCLLNPDAGECSNLQTKTTFRPKTPVHARSNEATTVHSTCTPSDQLSSALVQQLCHRDISLTPATSGNMCSCSAQPALPPRKDQTQDTCHTVPQCTDSCRFVAHHYPHGQPSFQQTAWRRVRLGTQYGLPRELAQ